MQGYDYIGAPWRGINYFNSLNVLKIRPYWYPLNLIRYKSYKNNFGVGNGGFSLRNVRMSLFSLHLFKNIAEKWTLNEDIFWTIVSCYLKYFKMPSPQTALEFSFELMPRECFRENNYQLPFGCHAWEKYDIDFWKPILSEYGYRI